MISRFLNNAANLVAKQPLCLLAATLFFLSAVSNSAAFPTNPSMKPVKWRIGCYQGGDVWEYNQNLKGILLGLMELGWIEKADISKYETTGELWKWASVGEMKSDYLAFAENAFYNAHWGRIKKRFEAGMNAKEGRAKVRREIKEKIIARLSRESDLDLMIAMGTWAGQDLANDRHSVPVVVVSCSDPIGSGIIKSVEDPGFGHVHARVDPFRYQRQLNIFHDFVGFEKLGMAYKNTPAGRTYAAVGIAEKLALARGFSIVSRYIDYENVDLGEVERDAISSYRELCSETDAIYVTIQAAVNSRTLPVLAKNAIEFKTPAFSMRGPHEVRAGILMSAGPNFNRTGLFHAGNISKIFNGAKPGKLKQFFEDSPKIAINLKTAKLIGYEIPSLLMEMADIKYDKIEP